MESIHKTSGKVFTGKFAETAVRLGLAKPVKEKDNFNKMPPEWKERNIPEIKKSKEVKPKVKSPAKKAVKKAKK